MGRTVRKVGDAGALAKIRITVRGYNREAINLTGYSASIIVAKSGGANLFTGACTVTDAVNGVVEYEPLTTDLSEDGEFHVQLKITEDAGTGVVYVDVGTMIIEETLSES